MPFDKCALAFHNNGRPRKPDAGREVRIWSLVDRNALLVRANEPRPFKLLCWRPGSAVTGYVSPHRSALCDRYGPGLRVELISLYPFTLQFNTRESPLIWLGRHVSSLADAYLRFRLHIVAGGRLISNDRNKSGGESYRC